MINENKFITMLYKKHPIRKNEFIYTPVKSIIVDELEDGFYDYKNNVYYPITEEESLKDNNSYALDPYVFFYDDYKKAVEEEYKNDVNEHMMLKHFDKNFSKKYYLTKFSNDKVYVSAISTDMEKKDVEDYDEIEYDIDLLKNIEEGNYSKEELEELKRDIYYRKVAIDELNELVKEAEYKSKNNEDIDEYEKRGIININKLYKKVTKTLIAQDKAAKEFITELAMLDLDNNNKKGILVTGDTGVGKTKLIQLVAKYLNRPFLIIDSTQLTMPGYTGKDIEEYLYELIENCNYNMEEAENAIVFFDEIDKKGSAKKGDVSGQGVLNQLLKFLDGETYTACKDTKNKGNTAVEISTHKMIVIAGGAFTDVYNSKDSKKISGFNQNEKEIINEITVDDFVNKAQMPREFMGRCSVIHLRDLDSKDYERILKESDESPIIFAKNRFEIMDNVKLSFTDEYLKKSSQLAKTKNIGVRGLNGIIIKSIREPFIDINQNLGVYEEVIIDKNVLEDPKKYQLIKRKEEKNNEYQKVKIKDMKN